MINKILNINITNFFSLFFIRKLSRFNKIYFVPTAKIKLPRNNHPVGNLKKFFTDQIKNYYKKKFNLDLFKVIKKYFKKNNNINLLDFGGENLDLYLYLSKNFPKIKIVVINQTKINNYLKKIIREKNIKNIQVFNNIRQIKSKKFNFINFGSSLQYVANYEFILFHLLKRSRGFFYLSASSFFFRNKFKKNIVVKQVNLLPTVMYCYIFNYYYIKKIFAKYRYFIIKKKINSFKKVNFKNFKFKISYLNILFYKAK
jgi:hypothetical protein